jgi:diguanylate cyclase (GGDEF)-like protein
VISWEKATNGALDAIGLRSIKVKIILFALLATLIPSLTMGWLSYRNNRRAIDEKVVEELTSLTSHAAREVSLWLKERRYEMKILSSSYEVSENLAKLNRPDQVGPDKAVALKRLQDYLESIGKKFGDYHELFAVDLRGNVVASSTGPPGNLSLGRDWVDRTRTGEGIPISATWDKALRVGTMVIVEPIRSADGTLIGALGAKVSFDQIQSILTSYTKEPSQELYLMTQKGEILAGSRPIEGLFMASRLDTATADLLFSRQTAPLEFISFRGTKVLGDLRTVPELDWGVVAEKDRVAAYAAIDRLRNVTLALIAGVLLAIGLAAYLLGLTIVRPLGRLTQGAARVAGGDLDVDLPIDGRSEVSYMTEVFNDMVARLRRFRDENAAINHQLLERNEELRRISITDSLTGLYNRTQLPEVLARELARSQRHERRFSILMIDIDHFKRFNDAHGHQAGDELLRQFAGILKGSIRACDFAARFGGEEFLVLLTETDPEGAFRLAESLRGSAEALRPHGEARFTISIGVASYPQNGDDVESLIRQADDALYDSKRMGRNQVVAASGGGGCERPSKVSSG